MEEEEGEGVVSSRSGSGSAAVELFLRRAREARVRMPQLEAKRLCQALCAIAFALLVAAAVVLVSVGMGRTEDMWPGTLVLIVFVPVVLFVVAHEVRTRRNRARRFLAKTDARSGVQLLKTEDFVETVRDLVQRTGQWPTMRQVRKSVELQRVDVDSGEEWTCVLHDNDADAEGGSSAWLVRAIFTSVDAPGLLGQARISTDWICVAETDADSRDMTPTELATALLLARHAVAFTRDVKAFARDFRTCFVFALSGAARVQAADGDGRVVARVLGGKKLALRFELRAGDALQAEHLLDGAWQAWEEHAPHILRHRNMTVRFAALYDALAACTLAPQDKDMQAWSRAVPRVPSL